MLSRWRPKFTRQLAIGPYIADFACRQARLIVELDGSQHADSLSDKTRDESLRQEGWTVLRIWNNELNENPEGVFQAIADRAAECLGRHPPPAPPFQGGEDEEADRLEFNVRNGSKDDIRQGSDPDASARSARGLEALAEEDS